MNKSLYIIIIILAFIIISLIYPIINYYTDKSIPPIPDHNTYKNVVSKILPDSIISKAERNKCRQYIVPVEQVTGDISSFRGIKDDINIALVSYDKWKLRVNKTEAVKMKKHLEERFEKWGAFTNPQEFGYLLSTQAKTESNTRYIAFAKLTSAKNSEGNDLNLSVTVNDLLTQNNVFEIVIPFAHPNKIKIWEQIQREKEEYLTDLENRAEISFYLTKGLTLLFISYILFVFIQKGILSKKNKEYAKFLSKEIEKRQKLVDDGHFVAALELAEKYLAVFPDDTEIIAFRDRLLDFTNNNPKKAQVAYVEARKLQIRLQMSAEDPRQSILSLSEKEDIKQLLPFNPSLKKTYNALVSAEESIKSQEYLQNQIVKIRQLMKAGKLNEAENEIGTISENETEFNEFRKIISDKKVSCKKLWINFIKSLKFDKNVSIDDKMQEVMKLWSDMSELLEFRHEMKYGKNKLKFQIKSNSKNIKIYSGNSFILGREDEDVKPDIVLDDKRVSRPHTKIFFKEDKIFIQDLNSTGGTYINGEKIEKRNLKNNDQLTIAKVLDFTVYLEASNSVLLRSEVEEFILLNNTIRFEMFNEKIKLGIGDNYLRYIDDMLILIARDSITVLFDGQEINFNGKKYTVEEIK